MNERFACVESGCLYKLKNISDWKWDSTERCPSLECCIKVNNWCLDFTPSSTLLCLSCGWTNHKITMKFLVLFCLAIESTGLIFMLIFNQCSLSSVFLFVCLLLLLLLLFWTLLGLFTFLLHRNCVETERRQ